MNALTRLAPPAPRGQSTVELALALLIFVSVAMLGIHFAEVGYLPIKVHEAAVSPLWDSTALRVHKWKDTEKAIGDFTPFPEIAPAVEANANGRYHDFDGRSSTPGQGDTSVTQVFTRIQDMLVRCEREDRVAYDLPRGGRPAPVSPTAGDYPTTPAGGAAPADPTYSAVQGVFENMGGVACSAEARLDTLPSLPTHFLDQGAGSFFNTPNAKQLTTKVCAVGRPAGGKCQGRFGILLGDWAFADDLLAESCPFQPNKPDVPCKENRTLYYAAKTVYGNASPGPWKAASDFAKFFTGYSPIDENGFFMSYRGEEDNYVENLALPGEKGDEVERPYNTGGTPREPPARRASNSCFLGLSKC